MLGDIDALVVLLGVPWLIYRVIVFIVKRKFSFKTELIKGLFFFASVAIYGLTIFPFPLYSYPYMEGGSSVNLIPFASIYGSLNHFYIMVPLRNIAGNILLFMPLGFMIPLRFNVRRLWKVVMYGFLTSLLVEVIQLLFTYRAFDVDDLLLNTLGAALGVTLYQVFRKLFLTEKTEKKQLTQTS